MIRVSMIRVSTCLCLLAILFGAAPVSANSRSGGALGVGLVVGEPTGITAEYYPRSPGFGQAVELTVGLDTFDDGHTYVHLIWKLYLTQLVRTSALDVPIYVGVGPWFAEGRGHDDIDIGGRMPFGIALDFRRAPLQVFLEIALQLEIVDDFHADIDCGLGFRYYF